MRRRWLALTAVALVAGLGFAAGLVPWLSSRSQVVLERPVPAKLPLLVRTADHDLAAFLTAEDANRWLLEVFRFDGASIKPIGTHAVMTPGRRSNPYLDEAVVLKNGQQFFFSFDGLIRVQETATGRILFESRRTATTFEAASLGREDPGCLWLRTRVYAAPPPSNPREYRKEIRSRLEIIRWEPVVTRELVFEATGSVHAYPISGSRLLCVVSEKDDHDGQIRVVDRASKQVVKEWKDEGRPGLELHRDYVVARTPRRTNAGMLARQ